MRVWAWQGSGKRDHPASAHGARSRAPAPGARSAPQTSDPGCSKNVTNLYPGRALYCSQQHGRSTRGAACTLRGSRAHAKWTYIFATVERHAWTKPLARACMQAGALMHAAAQAWLSSARIHMHHTGSSQFGTHRRGSRKKANSSSSTPARARTPAAPPPHALADCQPHSAAAAARVTSSSCQHLRVCVPHAANSTRALLLLCTRFTHQRREARAARVRAQKPDCTARPP